MNDKVSKWYEDTKNVDEMLDWRPALKEWEHVVFDQMLKQKKSIPFSKTISDSPRKQKTKPLKSK